MPDSYDGIVIGAGHNALVLHAYLARAGLSCVTLERAERPGGGLATIEWPEGSGFRHNVHSFFHRGIDGMPWFEELELARFGVRYLEPELNVSVVLRDGRTLEWWRDPERTLASIERFSARDAATVARWLEEFRPIAREILAVEASSTPLAPAERRAYLERSSAGRRLLEAERESPLERLGREIESEVVRAGLLFFNGLREIDLRARGFGPAVPALLASGRMAQLCVGGSASLARGLVAAIESVGGEVRCGVELERILVSGGRAVGVRLRSGEEIQARRFVASGVNPQQTLLDLIAPEDRPRRIGRRARGFRYNRIAPLFGLHLGLSEPPELTAYDGAAVHPLMFVLGLEGTGDVEAMLKAHDAGARPPFLAWGATPTRFDESQAPRGRHTAFLWQKVPYALLGNPSQWEREAEAHADQLLARWAEFAPNLVRAGVIEHRFHRTPLDTVRSLPNQANGDLLVGSLAGGQVGYHRPFAGAGQYRTPLEGLYLCGGSTHPGGNITGLCGHNAARVVAADLGLRLPSENEVSPAPSSIGTRPPLRVRRLRESDIEFGLSLSRIAGWNQLAGDWERLLALGAGGCFLAEWDGEPAGTVTTCSYGEIGWVGMVLVAPRFRRRGVASRLVRTAIDHLDGHADRIALDATSAGRLVYAPLGFRTSDRIERWVRRPGARRTAPPARSRAGSPRRLHRVSRPLLDLDAEAFGADRAKLLAGWLRDGPPFAGSLWRGGRAEGFALARRGRRYFHIGPIVARDRRVAESLLDDALCESGTSGVAIDVPVRDSAWIELLRRSGFRPERRFVRMVRSGSSEDSTKMGRGEWQWAIAGPEFG